MIAVFTALHWGGLRIGSTLTRVISLSVGLMLMVLVAGCFLTAPVGASAAPPAATSAASLPLLSLGMLAALVTALRAVFLTYDGWYSAIYLAEESTQPALTLPRAIIGGTILVAAMYVIFNIAILRVLPLPVLAASALPAADAARVVLPRGGAELVTVISLMTVLSLVNATLLMAPRVLLAIGRDGFFTRKAALVSAGGTPRVALGVTSARRGGAHHERHLRCRSSPSPSYCSCSTMCRPTSRSSCCGERSPRRRGRIGHSAIPTRRGSCCWAACCCGSRPSWKTRAPDCSPGCC